MGLKPYLLRKSLVVLVKLRGLLWLIKKQANHMNNQTPQLEDGFTQIANEIIEALAKCMPGFTEGQIIYAILRKTYGWHKKKDQISISQLIKMTGKSKRMIIYALQNLEAKKMIHIKRTVLNGEKQSNIIMFNKNYQEWVVQGLAPQVERRRQYDRLSSARLGKKVVQDSVKKVNNLAHTKETIQKIITKDNINRIIPYFEKVNPSYKRIFSNTSQRASLQRLVSQYGEERIKNLLYQLPSIIQRPYAPRITTPYELESKMGQLIAFMKQESIKINKGGVTKV